MKLSLSTHELPAHCDVIAPIRSLIGVRQLLMIGGHRSSFHKGLPWQASAVIGLMSDCQLEARPSKECQTTAFKAGLLGSNIATGTLELGGMQIVCLLAKKKLEAEGNYP